MPRGSTSAMSVKTTGIPPRFAGVVRTSAAKGCEVSICSRRGRWAVYRLTLITSGAIVAVEAVLAAL